MVFVRDWLTQDMHLADTVKVELVAVDSVHSSRYVGHTLEGCE